MIIDLKSANPNKFDRYYQVKFWYYTISAAFINTLIYGYNLYFLEIAGKDLMRRYYNMKIMNAMIEPNSYKKVGFI